MIAANSFEKLIKSITGCRCGTEVFAISLGIFIVSLVLFIFAMRMLKKAKALKMEAQSNTPIEQSIHAPTPPNPSTNIDLEETIKDINAVAAASSDTDFEENHPEEHEETQIHTKSSGGIGKGGADTKTATLPRLDMIPPPQNEQEDNDATVLMERKKPSAKE